MPARYPKIGRFLGGPKGPTVLGINKVRAAFKKKATQAQAEMQIQCVVGYTANYAVHVHESLEMAHPRGGQAKFLEQPAREKAMELGKLGGQALRKGRLGMALFLVGLRLQRESQLLVPVDTGHLRGSAFTRMEGGPSSR
jgi:hypothetical protein